MTARGREQWRGVVRLLMIDMASALARHLLDLLCRKGQHSEDFERRRQLLVDAVDSGDVEVVLRLHIVPAGGEDSAAASFSIYSRINTEAV